MRFTLAWAGLLTLVSCAPLADPGPAPTPAPAAPQRVVSLDYCADQFVLKLADPGQIAAVSMHADAPFSFLRAEAAGHPKVRTRTEDVIGLNPDLVVRAYGGGPQAGAMLTRAGVKVAQLGFADDLDGIKANITLIAEALGQPARGAALIAEMDRGLAAIPRQGATRRALYMTPSGYTSGPGSLVDTMIETAGLENFETQSGWHPVSLEKLAQVQPDLLITAFFGDGSTHPDIWSAARHPVVRAAAGDRQSVALEGASTACGGWFVIAAIADIAKAGATP